MTVKEELHRIVESLEADHAEEALDYLRWLASDGEMLSAEDCVRVAEGEQEIARGEYVRLTEYLLDGSRTIDVSLIGPRGEVYRSL